MHRTASRICLVVLLLSFVGTVPFLPADDGPLRIERITPDGADVPPARQIVVQFDRAVAPVGRMSRRDDEVPITITPSVKCQWQWLDPSSLACRLDKEDALEPATRYEVSVRPGITARDGSQLEKPVLHTFVTQRPAVRNAWFRTWLSPGTPVIQVVFTQPVRRSSVAAHLFISDGAGRRYPLRVESAEGITEPRQIITLFQSPPGKGNGPRGPTEKGDGHAVWLVWPTDVLPEDTAARLMVEPGVVSRLGSEEGVEDRVVVSFRTFPAFEFIGVRCRNDQGKDIEIKANSGGDSGRCNPLDNAALLFSSPVTAEAIGRSVHFEPDLTGGRTDFDPWENRGGFGRLGAPHEKGKTYPVYLPVKLKADRTYRVTSESNTLTDVFGRPLSEPIDLTFATDHRLPDYKLPYRAAVLESAEKTEMPVVVTNLDSVNLTYDRIFADRREPRNHRRIDVPAVEDTAFAVPLGIREMLDGRSGAVQGEVSTRPPVSRSIWERRFFAQVTPFQVHVKLGHYNTLVWVTDMADGLPVANAAVTIFSGKFALMPATPDPAAKAVTDQTGAAMLPGIVTLDPDLKKVYADGYRDPTLFIRVEKAGHLALVPITHDFRAETYRASYASVYPELRRRFGHMRAWGATAQGVYKAGDTVQYKIYVRDQNNETLVPPPEKNYQLTVYDPMGKPVHQKKSVALSEFGAFHGEFAVPAAAAVGWYRFELGAEFTDTTWEPMRVLVADFTPAPFRVTNSLNAKRYRAADRVGITTQAVLHGGGPFVDAPVRITATIESRPFASDDPRARGFSVDVSTPQKEPRQIVFSVEAKTDRTGEFKTDFIIPETDVQFGRLTVESAVRDDRGKYVTARSTADYAGTDRFVGLRKTEWVAKQDEPSRVEVIVMDSQGSVIAGVPVSVKIERRETKTARVKGAGNAYLARYVHQWIETQSCQVVSADQPVDCTFTPRRSGSYRITAAIAEPTNRAHVTQMHLWAAGKGQVVWEQKTDNSLEIIAEQTSIKVGDTARFLIKNPFPGAKALVSVERYGILKHWTTTLDTGTPVIEVPVEQRFAPGFFLSVVVVSARAAAAPADNELDLGKPTFRIGYLKVPVDDPANALSVIVHPGRDRYKPADRISVRVEAPTEQDRPEAAVEFAVAVIDEAVLDLLENGKNYFDPYRGFYDLAGLDLENYNLLMNLVGRQKFEKKGADTGGGGGGMDVRLRSEFTFLAYWNPSLTADDKGRAEFEFAAPDNLTGWRIWVMAVTPGARMGLGEGKFVVNRPTEIRPVVPNQVTEGDRFMAGFSVMNRTEKQRSLTVTIEASGAVKGDADAVARKTETIEAAPFERATIRIPLHAAAAGSIRLTASGGDEIDRDGVVHTIPVLRRTAFETGAAYGASDRPRISEIIQYPENIRTDVGELSLTLSPSIIGGLEGVFRYAKLYPYTCWEQILTKGLLAAYYLRLKTYLAPSFIWEESESTPDRTLAKSVDHQAPNGAMTYYVPADENASPYLSAYTALAFNRFERLGYEPPAAVVEKLDDYLAKLLRQDVLPDFYTKGMAATVRAVALSALAERGKIDMSDIDRYQPHIEQMSLFGKAHFLLAALQVPGTESIRQAVWRRILSHAEQSGGKIVFSERVDAGFERILASTMRTNGAVLSAMVKFAETPEGKARVGDMPAKLVRTLIQTRRKNDHWENTQDNIFCIGGLVDYADRYEQEAPRMRLSAFLDGNLMGEADFAGRREAAVAFKRPIAPGQPGRTAETVIRRDGKGRFYYDLLLTYAPKDLPDAPLNAGIEVHREYAVHRENRWAILKQPMTIQRGDLVKVDLFVSLPAARNFVVVSDPVPGGLEPVNRDLATASQVDAAEKSVEFSGESRWFQRDEWISFGYSRWCFYHKELRHDFVRFYSEYLPAGDYHLTYTAQAVAEGRFVVKPVHAEEMYAPDVYGHGAAGTLVVE